MNVLNRTKDWILCFIWLLLYWYSGLVLLIMICMSGVWSLLTLQDSGWCHSRSTDDSLLSNYQVWNYGWNQWLIVPLRHQVNSEVHVHVPGKNTMQSHLTVCCWSNIGGNEAVETVCVLYLCLHTYCAVMYKTCVTRSCDLLCVCSCTGK